MENVINPDKAQTTRMTFLSFLDVSLEPVTRNDLEDIMNWRMHPEVTKYMYTDPKLTKEDQTKWYENVVRPGRQNGTDYFFVIRHNDKSIGLVSITDVTAERGAFWAFYLSPDVPRGKGIGSKVEYMVIDFVFNNLDLHKLRCEVFEFNEKVIKMHEKFGFRREAFFRDFIIKNGTPHNVVGIGLLRKEWNNGLKDVAIARLTTRG